MTEIIPKTCKAIVLDGPRAPWSLRDVPVESPKEGEILIKSLACGICHSVRRALSLCHIAPIATQNLLMEVPLT